MAETAEPVEAATGWLSETEMQSWRALIQTTTGLLAVLDRELQREHRLTLAEYEVLAIISDAGDGGLRMQELAETLHLSPSGVTRRVDGMVRQGLVVRRQCSEDRRRLLRDAHRRRVESPARSRADPRARRASALRRPAE